MGFISRRKRRFINRSVEDPTSRIRYRMIQSPQLLRTPRAFLRPAGPHSSPVVSRNGSQTHVTISQSAEDI